MKQTRPRKTGWQGAGTTHPLRFRGLRARAVYPKRRLRLQIVMAAAGLLLPCVEAKAAGADFVVESPKQIPVVCEVDVVVVGGSSGAVECACEAARRGARVFLLAPRPYLGTDICSTLRLWLEEDERPVSELAETCEAGPGRVKRAAADALGRLGTEAAPAAQALIAEAVEAIRKTKSQ